MKIGSKLKEFRIRNKFKQGDLVDAFYMTKTTMSRMEANIIEADDRFIFIWKTKYNINKSWLTDDNEPMVAVPNGRNNYLPILPTSANISNLKNEHEYIGFVEITPEELSKLEAEVIVIRVTTKQPLLELGRQIAVTFSFDENNLDGLYLVSYLGHLSLVDFPVSESKISIGFDGKIKNVSVSDLKIVGKQIPIESVDRPKPI